jgi:hypothetical protein
MAERPIYLTGPEVRAVVAGVKTQARRPLREALVVMRPHNRVTRGLFPSTQMKRPLSVYRCWYATSEVYHVGHLVVQR